MGMNDNCCPWCEAVLLLEAGESAEQSCPECLTTWLYEDEPVELALAA
jgi:hypothetical protein